MSVIRRHVRPRPTAAVATGPLVREETEYGGRITLTMLFENGKHRLRALLTMERLAEAIWDRHALDIEHHLLDPVTMEQDEYVPLWRRVAREGILLFGTLP